jgi:hypothetical protein
MMAVSPFTNDFMKALPAPLRPNPYNAEEFVMMAVEKGWHTDALAKACYINDRQPNPAFVITNLKNLCQMGPTQETVRKGWTYGHVPCGEKYHEHGCEICRCIPGEENHHISSVKRLVTLGVTKDIPND